MRLLRILAAASLFAASTTGAQTNRLISKPMTLEECLTQALEHNLEVRIDRVNPDINRYNLNVANAGYDPNLFFQAGRSDRTSPGGIIPGTPLTFPASTTKADSFSAGIGGSLPTDSGMTYSLSGDAEQSEGSNFPRTTEGRVALSLTQPLLRNLWIDPIRYTIALSRNQLDSSEWGVHFRIMDIITRVETAYYDLIAARENVKVQEGALELAEQLLAENRKRVEVGALAPLDEKQAESQVAASRADLLSARNVVSIQQNVLKGLLSDDFSRWQHVMLEPSEPLVAVPESFDVQASWKNGITLRPDLEQARLAVDRLGITLKYQKNQLFPQLDLVGTFGRLGRSTEYSGFFGDIENSRGPFYSIRAEFSVPLGRREARNTYRAVRAQEEQAVLQLKQLEQGIMLQIDNAVKLAETDLQRVEATRERRLYAEQALDAERKKLENGKSTSFFVLQFQRDLTEARSAEIQALADYNKALSELAFSEGTTLQRHRMRLVK